MIGRILLLLLVIEAVVCTPAWNQDSRPSAVEEKNWLRSYETLKQFMRSGAGDIHEKCGLPAITFAIHNRNSLTPELSSALQILETRPTAQKSIILRNFRVHYDTSGQNAAAMLDSLYQKIPGSADQFADSVAAIANYCEDFETQVLGYPPSPGDSLEGGGPEYDIYVTDLRDYGATTPEPPNVERPDGSRWTSFITIDNSFQFVSPPVNKGLPALRVTLAHELHHSIQIGNYGYWTNDIFFYEITSTWMEDVVFTQVNDYYQYTNLASGHFNNPQTPFNDNGFIMYSRSIWGHYIAKRFGRDAMRRTWEEIGSVAPLQAIDQALSKQPYGSSFRSAFAEWSLWNYFTGPRSDTMHFYPEGAAYRAIQQAAIDFVPPQQTETGALNTLGSKYFDIKQGLNESPLVLSSLNLSAGEIRKDSAFAYSFSISNSLSSTSYINSNSGLFISLSVPDQGNWYLTFLNNGTATSSPFPDPFKADGRAELNIPVSPGSAVTGTLSIFSSDMTLVYSSSVTSEYSAFTRGQVFQWNGVTNKNRIAGSGVYIFFLEFQGHAIKGKFAVLRN